MSSALRATTLALLALPLLVFAQDAPPPTLGVPTAAAPAGTVNCFDYYHFGSVQVDVTPTVASAVSGTPITFIGAIKNQNPYPVTDGAVYIKIFRQRGDGTKDSNGPDVVDQFYAADNLSIPANGSLPITFNWNVPSYAASGEYKVATFFTVSRKFNLLGLPFTDDVVGNTASFKVSGEQKATVGFKKDSVTVNTDSYHFAAYPPREGASAPVTVEATITNPTGDGVTVPVTWSLYHWSQNDQANLIVAKNDQVTIAAGKSATVSYTVSDAAYPVYLLQGVATWHDTSSIINVRFVRESKDQLRINFPSITSYPLQAGQQTTLFSCLHNAGSSDVVPDSHLVLTLLDRYGGTIHSYTYTGGVTGAMMGVADHFTPDRTYNAFKLQAQLYQGNNLVDQSEVSYDCHALDPANCAAEGEGDLLINVLITLFKLVASLVVIGILIYFSRRSSAWGTQQAPKTKTK